MSNQGDVRELDELKITERLEPLVKFLYETKLILFFPQMHYILAPKQSGESTAQFLARMLSLHILFETTDILWDLFQHNFAGGVSENLETGNQTFDASYIYLKYTSDEYDNHASTPDDAPNATGLAYEFQGKIYLSDWLILMNSLYPPTRPGVTIDVPDFTHAETSKAYWGYVDQERASGPSGWPHAPVKLEDPEAGSDVHLTFESLRAAGGIPSATSAITPDSDLTWTSFFYNKWKGSSGLPIKKLFGYDGSGLPVGADFDAAGSVQWGPTSGDRSFLAWLYKKPVKDIYEIEFGNNMTQYISERDTPGIHNKFRDVINPYAAENPDDPWALTDKLLKEKIGHIRLRTTTGFVHYVAIPLFNVAKKMPSDLNYFDYIYKAGGASLTVKTQWIFTWAGMKAEPIRAHWNPPLTESEYRHANFNFPTFDEYRAMAYEQLDPGGVYAAGHAIWNAATPEEKHDSGYEFEGQHISYYKKKYAGTLSLAHDLQEADLAKAERAYYADVHQWADANPYFPGQWAPIPIRVDEAGNLTKNPEMYDTADWKWPGPQKGASSAKYPKGGAPPRWIGLQATPRGDLQKYEHAFQFASDYHHKHGWEHPNAHHNYSLPDMNVKTTNAGGSWRGNQDTDFKGGVVGDGFAYKPPGGVDKDAVFVGGGQHRPGAGYPTAEGGLKSYAGAEDNVPMNYCGTWWKFVDAGIPGLINDDTVDLFFGQKYNDLTASTLRFLGGLDSLGSSQTAYLNASAETFFRMMTEEQRQNFDRFIQSFFLKEQTTMISVIHRILSQQYYPEIEFAFDRSLSIVTNSLLTAIAVAHGDYKFTTPSNDTEVPFPFSFDIDWGAIAEMILKAMLGGLASAVDPTWRTDWFLPGPFTPVGVAAKLLIDKNWCFGENECDDPANPRDRKDCADALEEQIKLIDLGPFFNK